MPNIEKFLEESYLELERLRKQVSEIHSVHENINLLIQGNDKIPELFDDLLLQVKKSSTGFVNELGATVGKYINGNNQIFSNNLNKLKDEVGDLQKEVNRLNAVDFNKLFSELQKEFIEKTGKDLEVEYKKIDEKAIALQSTNDDLSSQARRFESIDLEKHFDKLQKTLSDIFQAVNSINLTLTAITQTLGNIAQSIGELRDVVQKNHSAIFQKIDEQGSFIKNNFELLTNKSDVLSQELKKLNKGMLVNRIINGVGIFVILALLIYLIVK